MGKTGAFGTGVALSKKSNIEIALDEQIKSLGGVQAEMIKKHVRVWRWNTGRIEDIQDILKSGKSGGAVIDDKERTSLVNERHKLVTENGQLYSHINRALKDKPEETDEFDAFMKGK